MQGMYRYVVHAFVALSLVTAAFSQSPPSATAASSQQLIGTWTLVRVDNLLPDGARVHLYGDAPQGILTFDTRGRYTLQILRSGRPKFDSNDKSKGTPDENAAAVQGSNAHWGRYSVNDADGTLTFYIDHASFPNWEGTQQKRKFTLVGDRLKYTVPAPTTGTAAVGEVEWQRAD
jgi:hypothetical protein